MKFEYSTKDKITEDDIEISILDILNEYADIKTNFKNQFLDDVEKVFKSRGYITAGQYCALVDIFYQLVSKGELCIEDTLNEEWEAPLAYN